MKRGHKSPIPTWAMSDRKLQNVVAAYLERRAGVRKDGPIAGRIKRCEDALRARIPELKARLALTVEDYRAQSAGGADETALRKVETLVASIDSELWLIQNGIARLTLAIAYHRYPRALTSTEIAEIIKTRPAHVRKILSKLSRIGGDLYGHECISTRPPDKHTSVPFHWIEGCPFTLFQLYGGLNFPHIPGTVCRATSFSGDTLQRSPFSGHPLENSAKRLRLDQPPARNIRPHQRFASAREHRAPQLQVTGARNRLTDLTDVSTPSHRRSWVPSGAAK